MLNRRDRLSSSTTSSLICLLEVGEHRKLHQVRQLHRQFRSRVSTCRRHHQRSTVPHQHRTLSTRFHLDRMYQQIRPVCPLDVCRNVDRTTTATTVINLVTSRTNVLNASGGLKEHQPQTRTYLLISLGGHDSTCVLDTGCDHSMLPRRLVRNTPLQPTDIVRVKPRGLGTALCSPLEFRA